MYNFIAAGLAFVATASALPAPQGGPTCFSTAKTAPFGLQVTIDGVKSTLAPSMNGTSDSVLLYTSPTDSPVAYGLLPCSGGTALMVNISDADYSINVPDIGLIDGVADTLYGNQKYFDYNFTIGNESGDTITHSLTHADEGFLACQGVVDGVETYVLSWGSENFNGTYHYGCQYTTLYVL